MSQHFSSPAVEESVACNLIPMIDIMFLLLLFFMLGADMTQRQLEEVRLPKADRCAKDENGSDGIRRTTVNVFHRSSRGNQEFPPCLQAGRCLDEDDWRIAIRGDEYTMNGIASRLREEAELDAPETRDAAGRRTSPREIMIRADQDAPYSVIQRVIESCAAVGLYKVEVGAAKPGDS
jgi:biopolymer transport protein ExbD